MRRVNHKNKPLDHERARELRHRSSPFEQQLWKELRQLSKATGMKFRRQHPLSPYIADFVCIEAMLIVELDGPSHDARQEYDRKRDNDLRQWGYTILRFGNHELISNKQGVVATIAQEAKKLIERARNPSPAKTKGLPVQAQVFASSPAGGEEKESETRT